MQIRGTCDDPNMDRYNINIYIFLDLKLVICIVFRQEIFRIYNPTSMDQFCSVGLLELDVQKEFFDNLSETCSVFNPNMT